MENKKNAVVISDAELRAAAGQSEAAFLNAVVQAMHAVTGGDLTAQTMPLLNAHQHTLEGYWILREQLLEGGFCQLIQNGYGPYIFDNPFAKSLRVLAGLGDLSKLVYKAKKIYDAHRADLERERTQEEFMAMYEEYDAFDDVEDTFIETEEMYTAAMAHFVDENLAEFVTVQGV